MTAGACPHCRGTLHTVGGKDRASIVFSRCWSEILSNSQVNSEVWLHSACWGVRRGAGRAGPVKGGGWRRRHLGEYPTPAVLTAGPRAGREGRMSLRPAVREQGALGGAALLRRVLRVGCGGGGGRTEQCG